MPIERDNNKLSKGFHNALERAKAKHYPVVDVYTDASGKPTAREYEDPEEGGYIREELR